MWEYVYKNPNKVGFITYTIIAVLIVFIIFMFFYLLSLKIASPSIRSLYSVLPNSTATSLYVCGPDSNSECIFTVKSLDDAINLCNKYLNICQQFTLSTDMTMKIVDGIFAPSSSSNAYLYQFSQATITYQP